MNIAIVGSSGYIAQHFINDTASLKDIRHICRIGRTAQDDFYLELNRPEQFDYSVLDAVDFLIFTAAISSPDSCKNDFTQCWNVNVAGTEFFINEALKRNCHVIFISSDAVFGTDTGKAFDEDSETNADSSYGMMKKRVEDDFKSNSNFKAVRLSYVVSATDKFAAYCRVCMERGETAEIFHPFYRNCITVRDVVGILVWLIQNWEIYEHDYINAAGTELVSRVRIADEINRLFPNRLKYKIVSPDKEFFSERAKIIQMKSKYIEPYEMIKTANFTEKIALEWEGVHFEKESIDYRRDRNGRVSSGRFFT